MKEYPQEQYRVIEVKGAWQLQRKLSALAEEGYRFLSTARCVNDLGVPVALVILRRLVYDEDERQEHGD